MRLVDFRAGHGIPSSTGGISELNSSQTLFRNGVWGRGCDEAEVSKGKFGVKIALVKFKGNLRKIKGNLRGI